MNKLKERLEPVRLTEEQKQRILTNAKKPAKIQRTYIPVILPAFLLLSVFFVVLQLNSGGGTVHTTTTAAVSTESAFRNLPLAVIIWAFVGSVELIALYFVAKACVAKTPRWHMNEKVQELRAFFVKPVQPKLVLLLAMVLLWAGTFYFASLWYSQLIFVLLSVNLGTGVLLYVLRDQQRSHCPHCHTVFTRKQIFRKTYMPFREKCDTCHGLIYLDKNQSSQIMIVVIMSFLPTSLSNFMDLPIVYVLLFSGLFVASATYFCIPVMMRFTDKDTTMDDWKK